MSLHFVEQFRRDVWRRHGIDYVEILLSELRLRFGVVLAEDVDSNVRISVEKTKIAAARIFVAAFRVGVEYALEAKERIEEFIPEAIVEERSCFVGSNIGDLLHALRRVSGHFEERGEPVPSYVRSELKRWES